ncbi:MAG: CoF synthetase [Firmicutes bacterium HGW-Firmicutes-15]|nr:MAG: CoF synthetase [Firmicutes bacterium HGW-Firmicutes-15]
MLLQRTWKVDVRKLDMDRNFLELVLQYAEKSSFYRNLYHGHFIERFTDVPLINKQMLLDDQSLNPPFGSNVCVESKKIARLHRTSGTTMRPLTLVLTASDIEHVIMGGRRAFRTAGMDENDIVFNCMNYCMWMGGFMDHQSMEATGAAVVPYGVGKTENLIAMLLEIDSPCIHSTPSYLAAIRKVLREKYGLSPRYLGLKKGFLGGEAGMQDEVFRKKIEDEWEMKAINANYGLSEVMSILGAECDRREGLHFTASPFLQVEIIDSASGLELPLKAGVIGEMVLTNLVKEAQPLIRYSTGDIIEIISTDVCPCGNEGFRFLIRGRSDDMLVIKGINFYPEAIRPLLSKYPECTGTYIVRVPNRQPIDEISIRVQVLTGEQNHFSLAEEIKKEIRDRLFITPEIILVQDLEGGENKIRLVERWS